MPCGVFISYLPADQQWADHVRYSLQMQGIPCRASRREEASEGGSPASSLEGSLIMILSSSQAPLPRQLVRELERIQDNGLELRPVRAHDVRTPMGLGAFLEELRRSGMQDQYSFPSRFLQAVPRASGQVPFMLGAPVPRALLPAPKTTPVSKGKAAVVAGALAAILLIGVDMVRPSSAELARYEQTFAAQQAAGRRAEDLHTRAQEALESAQHLASQDRWQEADRELTSAITLDESYAQAYFERGRARFWERNYRAAIEDFNSVIRLDANLASGATTLKILAQQAQARRIHD